MTYDNATNLKKEIQGGIHNVIVEVVSTIGGNSGIKLSFSTMCRMSDLERIREIVGVVLSFAVYPSKNGKGIVVQIS